jgi:hypothetical protein
MAVTATMTGCAVIACAGINIIGDDGLVVNAATVINVLGVASDNTIVFSVTSDSTIVFSVTSDNTIVFSVTTRFQAGEPVASQDTRSNTRWTS